MRSQKSSSGDGHPYLKGFRFWNVNRFWLNGKFSQASVDYYENWLADLQKNEKQMTRLQIHSPALKVN